MMNARYLPYIAAINEKIICFNKIFRESHQIPIIDTDRMIDDGVCIQVIHGDWDAFPFPKAESRGVYFIFGYEKCDESNLGVYIGKASFGSTIGRRLTSHFSKYRHLPFFEMNGYNGSPFVLESMISIDLEEQELAFMAPSLEEYLITGLRSQIHLMNGTGNRARAIDEPASAV